jgi:hypothetical protein
VGAAFRHRVRLPTTEAVMLLMDQATEMAAHTLTEVPMVKVTLTRTTFNVVLIGGSELGR